ncbi:Exopolyphosphatase [Coemansia sp. RSA 2523]|nr:Exopolyphosphatase [Coemansia sp. RSA 2523]KAJ2186907.1 Exopolyphosphatase [Coemansia sp. RSA 532]KAJ2226750.1 Exopolyphosphatase [Coemansia sp. RSA 518]KAJ2531839.1 Exopolyphosphatase [Coemansia sp. RSA 1935]KAJ2723755.1 Exopolyphosphatase [Coemansia sp. D1744]
MKGFGLFVKTLAANTARLNSLDAHTGRLTLVLGNESADLDSMVSSLALAYALSPTISAPPIPIINTNRSDMTLRPESTLLLRTTLQANDSGIDALTFIDDFDLTRVVSYGRKHGLDVWLVDHNAPASRQTELEPFVRGIVDHHVDENRCPQAERQIELVGSCATLVAERLRNTLGSVEPELAKMLVAPILIDTSELSSTARRATDKDIEMVSWLVPQVEWAWPSANPVSTDSAVADQESSDEVESLDHVSSTHELYKILDKLKGKVSHLSARDLLRKDYKQWTVGSPAWTVGISSISYRLQKWIKRDSRKQIKKAVEKWVDEQKLDVALVMTHGKAKQGKGGVKVYGRDLIVAFGQSVNEEQQRRVLDGLQRSELLGLEPFFEDQDTGPVFFNQTRTESSRKQVFPAIKAVIESLSI